MEDFLKKQYTPICYLATNIGDIAIFSLSVKEFEFIGNQGQRLNTYDYMNIFIQHSCHKKDVLIDNLYKPQTTTLSLSETKEIADEYKEEIARLWLEKNDYLYTKTISSIIDGVTEIKQTDEIEYPKNSNETHQEYLHRIHSAKLKMWTQEISNKLGYIPKFNNIIDIGNQVNLATKLSKSIKALTTLKPVKSNDSEKKLNKQIESVFTNNPQTITNDNLSKLIEINSQMAEFLINSNSLQTDISNQIKSSTDVSINSAKENKKISLFVLFITIVGIIIPLYTNYSSNNANSVYMKKIEEGLNSINHSIKENNEDNQTIKKLKEDMDSIVNYNKILVEEIKKIKSK